MQNNPWLKYPKQKPNDDQRCQDFLVFYTNPRFIHKTAFQSRIPKLISAIAFWSGDDFRNSNYDKLDVLFYMPIPELPEN